LRSIRQLRHLTIEHHLVTTGTTTSTNNLSLYNLAHLKATDFAVTIGSATANLLLTDSNTKILQNPRIRATDAQKATMKIGERIPIATGSYQTGAWAARPWSARSGSTPSSSTRTSASTSR
jgi:type II secretory pathway component GspD/PulD (secretin)